jgi:hypothetical protein
VQASAAAVPRADHGRILKISETSFVDHLNGISLNFTLPSLGGVLQVIGNVNFADDTFSGRNTRGDTTAFCNYLAGPLDVEYAFELRGGFRPAP